PTTLVTITLSIYTNHHINSHLILLFLYTMTPRPPISTLFPYTTLFRSDGSRDVHQVIEDSGLGEFEVGKALYGLITAGFLHRAGDRKSTRLNSSHGSISYAVFCLKKKKHSKMVW